MREGSYKMSTTLRRGRNRRRAVIDFPKTGPILAALAGAFALLFLLLGLVAPAQAQGAKNRTFVAGEAVAWVKAGAGTLEQVQQVANAANCDVIASLRMRDVYHLRVRSADGKPPADAQTLEAIDKLKQSPLFRHVGPNRLFYTTDVTPNDPRFPEQWHLPLMRVPSAWDIEKGKASVLLAVIDTGIDPNHPDLKDRLSLPSANTTGTGAADDPTDTNGHGTHVSGIAAAMTNNGVGIAGVAFEGVKILAIKASTGGAFTLTALIDALQIAQDRGADIVNMSLAGADNSDTPDLNDPFNAKILQMAQNGIIFTMAAGNEFQLGNPPSNPANMANVHPNIYCVAACGRSKEHADYSNARPYTTITAPGGNGAHDILSTLPVNQGSYGGNQGTSMAAPAAAGVIALMLSLPGVQPSDVRTALLSTTNPRFTSPTPEFGYGVIDAYEAVVQAAVSVVVLEPQGTGGKASIGVAEPLETLLPFFRIRVGQVTPDKLQIKLDSTVIGESEYTITNITSRTDTGTPLRYEVVFEREVGPGRHTVEVSGTSPNGFATSDTLHFLVQPRVIPAGRSLIAIPYLEDRNGDGALDSTVTPELYFGGGTGFQLVRWIPGLYYPVGEGEGAGKYAFYGDSGTKDPFASFTPGDTSPHQDGGTTNKAPIGLAYWTKLQSGTPILTRGRAVTDRPLIIPLRGTGASSGRFISWNMVGDPFPFDVAFNACLVDTPEGRLSIQEAVDKNYLLPNIYTYDGENGYTFRTLPDGALIAWTGHWIGVTSTQDIALVVPPLRTSRAASLSRAPTVGKDGWSLRLSAALRDLRDTHNFIGVSSRAANGYDLGDVMKPPLMSPYVSLGIHNEGWGHRSGIYAQDLRAPGGTKTWSMVVSTDQPESDVTVSWGGAAALPRHLKLRLKDETTGQVVDMRTRSSITIRTDSTATPRRFTITATSGSGPLLRISNVTVRSTSGSRASASSQIGFTLSGDANYDVRVLSATGKAVSTVASRAGAAGDVRLVWNGKDAAGRSVPAGTYLVQIRATNAEGESVKVIQPFAILR